MQTQIQTPSQQQKTASQQSQNPQQSKSLRKAAAKLKQKQCQIQIIKKRFQVLKGQQDYNRYRTLDQERRIKQHQSMHESIMSDRVSMEKRLMMLKEKEEKELKERHDLLLKEMKEKSKDVFGDMMASRVSQYNSLKEQSKINDEVIQQNKKQVVNQNTKRKQSILSQQKRQQILVKQFKQTHMKDVLGHRSMEASRMTQLTQNKDKQLQRLMEFQQEMLKKASQSIAMNQKLKGEFGKVFVDVKARNSVKLPSISRGSGSYRTNQSNLSRNLSIYEI